ncbi:MAG: zinc metalloprotease HtpX [Candidatus Saccharicenans sp.]|uniref:zinc metalloprotease HtpX n=1 Tax=Candidatus Saccharicenans sp. TaxID=2819258 RepID=UPI00404B63AF
MPDIEMVQNRKLLPASYWEIQKKQQRISILLFFLLFLFYLLTVGLISGSILLSLGLFLPGFSPSAGSFFMKYTAIVFSLSLVLTLVNFLQAKKRGVQYILKNLRACSPDPEDRYHLSFLNVLEEMKISSGLPELRGYIIPTVNLNSLSLIGPNKQPAIVVTEGLLAETSRDELQAVVAHETAHILKGDTFLLTLVCSIVAFYEELIDSLDRQKELSQVDLKHPRRDKGVGQPLIYLASFFSYLLLNFFITIISQKRELLADATAVELCRDPLALARVIYKAQVANSYLGDSSVFTPLFLVPPDSRDIRETTRDKLFNTHPPVGLRLKLLAEMAHKNLKEIIEEVRAREEQREKARTRYSPLEESSPEQLEKIKKLQQQAREGLERDSIWLARNAHGHWEGPYVLGSLITLPYFTPATRIRNIKENLEGPARNFRQIRFALYRQLKNQPLDLARHDKCPVCDTGLVEAFYEGVKIKKCQTCQGKLVAMNDLEKIFARREMTFPESLQQKARAYREALLDPNLKPPVLKEKPPAICPRCGLQFTLRPFSYHYLLPVYKCYQCQVIWFEDQELELLQILIEEKTAAGAGLNRT